MIHDGVWKSGCQGEKTGEIRPDPPPPHPAPPFPRGEAGRGASFRDVSSALWKTPSDSIYRARQIRSLSEGGEGPDRRQAPSGRTYGTPMAVSARLAHHVKRLI